MTTIRATAICMRCKKMLIDPKGARSVIRDVMVLNLNPVDVKQLTHGAGKDGTPCGGRITMVRPGGLS